MRYLNTFYADIFHKSFFPRKAYDRLTFFTFLSLPPSSSLFRWLFPFCPFLTTGYALRAALPPRITSQGVVLAQNLARFRLFPTLYTRATLPVILAIRSISDNRPVGQRRKPYDTREQNAHRVFHFVERF